MRLLHCRAAVALHLICSANCWTFGEQRLSLLWSERVWHADDVPLPVVVKAERALGWGTHFRPLRLLCYSSVHVLARSVACSDSFQHRCMRIVLPSTRMGSSSARPTCSVKLRMRSAAGGVSVTTEPLHFPAYTLLVCVLGCREAVSQSVFCKTKMFIQPLQELPCESWIMCNLLAHVLGCNEAVDSFGVPQDQDDLLALEPW